MHAQARVYQLPTCSMRNTTPIWPDDRVTAPRKDGDGEIIARKAAFDETRAVVDDERLAARHRLADGALQLAPTAKDTPPQHFVPATFFPPPKPLVWFSSGSGTNGFEQTIFC